MRPIQRISAVAISAVTVLGGLLAPGAVASAGPVPAPAVAVSPDVPGLVTGVYGQNAAGDAYYATYELNVGASGWVRRADGSTTTLARPPADGSAVGPDGRLWSPIDGSLWSVDPDGTMVEHPIVAPEATATTGIRQVAAGPDGRIWWIDEDRANVGSIATDGTGATTWSLAGAGGLRLLARGADGRMWVARSNGVIQAVATDGAVSTYPTLGRAAVALQATTGALYAIVDGSLVRIAADGSHATVASGFAGYSGVGTSQGWAWFESTRGDVLAVSPSGRLARFGMPQAYGPPFPLGAVALAPSAAGGFVAASQGRLARIASASVGENLSASGQVFLRDGMYVLRAAARGATPGGTPLTGRVEVVLWGSQLFGDSIGYFQEQRATVVATVDLKAGRATVDVPITMALFRSAIPGGLLHTFCCTVTVRRPGTPSAPGLSSPIGSVTGGPRGSYYGPVVPTTTAAWLDQASTLAIGRPLGSADQVRRAAALSAGTATRTSVARDLVGSASWTHHRVDVAFRRWLGRPGTSGEIAYWADRLAHGTTSGLDLALAVKDAARDASGPSNSARAAHLAAALHLPKSYGSGYRTKLDAGTPWADVVRAAYGSSAARQQRIADLGPRSSFTPSVGTLGSWLGAGYGDERRPQIAVLATLPQPNLGY